MTSSDTLPESSATTLSVTALRPVGIGLLIAAALWAIGDLIEISFARTDTLADGASFVVCELTFYAAMITYAWSLLAGARRGLAGSSALGRVGLVATGVAYLLVMVSGIVVNFAGIEAAAIGLAVGGIATVLGEIVAGVGILLRGPVPRPARAVFLVFGVTYTIATFLLQAFGDTARGPGYVVEFAMAAFWALIGLTILMPVPRGRNLVWFVAALVLGATTIVAVIIPQ